MSIALIKRIIYTYFAELCTVFVSVALQKGARFIRIFAAIFSIKDPQKSIKIYRE